MAVDCRNIYVWGVPADIREPEFRQLFEGFGPVASVKVCPARQGTQTYGFVNFCLRESAQAAILALNGSYHKGFQIQVKLADPGKNTAWAAQGPYTASSSSTARVTSQESSRPAPVIKVYVAGVPAHFQDDDLRKKFEVFGDLASVRILPSKQKGRRTCGFVNFWVLSAAHKAINVLDGADCEGTPMQVRIAAQGSHFPGETLLSQQIVSEERVTGTLQAWRGKYGWIEADERIDHADAGKHRGQVYVHMRDIVGFRGDREPSAGDRVSFVIYADSDGVGAGEVQIISRAAEARSTVEHPKAAVRTRRKPEVAGSLPASWWHALEGDCCPISLIPLEELECEPFGIVGSAEGVDSLPKQGLWGASARAALLSTPSQAVHWSDGMFLACSLVANGQMLDPVSMRPLSEGECESLDRYIEHHRFPPVHVAEAFALAQVAEDPDAARRLAALGREAASMLRIMFDEGSSASLASPPKAGEASPVEEALADDLSSSARPKRRWGRNKQGTDT